MLRYQQKTLFIWGGFPYDVCMEAETEIDFEHLKQYVGDDVSLIKEVFGLFKHQIDMWSKGLDPKADDAVWSGVMHSLKGTARAVGAKNLADLCEQGESMVGEEASYALREKIAQDVQFSIDKCLIEIGRWEYRQTLASMRS